MSWFDDQIEYRKRKDDEKFEDALTGIAGAILGRRLADALSQDEIARSAIEEILKYFRCKPKYDELPSTLKTVDEQLEYAMRPFSILRRNVYLEEGWYKDAVGPMLGTYREDGSAVALIPGKMSGYTFYDLKTGKRVKVTRKNAGLIDSEAICFYAPLPLRSLKMTDLLVFMLEQRSLSDNVLFFVLMGVSALLGLLSPMFSKWLFGDVLESGSISVLVSLAVFMLCFSVCRMFFGCYQALINSRIGIKQDLAVEAAVMNRLLSLPVSFFKDYASGELTQRQSYVKSLCSTMMNTIGTTGFTSLFSLIYIGQIFAFAPALVVPSLVVILVTVGFSTIVTLARAKINKEMMLISSKTSGMTYSMISGIQKIKLAGAEKRMFSRWAKHYTKEAELEYNPPTFIKISDTINTAISLAGSLVLYYCAIKSSVSVADYYAFTTAYGLVSGAFMSLAGLTVSIANIKPTLEMARPIMEAVPEINDSFEEITSLNGRIEVSNVSFRYSDDMPNVIDDLSLTVKPGEYLAIVGSTGCGKSTLLRLLLGFEKPQKGAVFYDSHDISRVDLKSLRRKIGVVMQDGKLFTGDVFENIVISAPQLSMDEAWEAAEIASIADDIREMPMGMNTLLSEGQGGISGGQRQRLMIARAVAPKPKILMFDEATSALDNLTQKKVSEAIDKLKCTRIVIAHRLSTIRHCDRIIVLDKGKIVEDGTYDQLVEKNGFFAELVARQRLDVDV